MSGKSKAILLMGVMFGLGVVTGSAWQTYRNHHFFAARTVYAERRIKRMTTQLHLSPQQAESLSAIFQKAHDRATEVNEEVKWDLEDIHRDSVHAIRELLTPEQRVEFEKLHRESHLHYMHMADDDLDISTATSKGGS